jgi:hypothetical protein
LKSPFIPNPQIGKQTPALRTDLLDANTDLAKRRQNGLDTEDQEWRVQHTTEALGRIN